MNETANNTNLLMKSDNDQKLCGHVSTKIDNSFELMTESEVIQFLRIPEISNSKDYHNVIEHLKKIRGLPRIHICRKALFPKKAILDWIEKESDTGK
ncbi:MAG: hypothetical protein JXB29_01470 [Sedimentisphaerales bacterium]|nr:hypothetical protein [Sedimentisphaerales bacterium]